MTSERGGAGSPAPVVRAAAPRRSRLDLSPEAARDADRGLADMLGEDTRRRARAARLDGLDQPLMVRREAALRLPGEPRAAGSGRIDPRGGSRSAAARATRRRRSATRGTRGAAPP